MRADNRGLVGIVLSVVLTAAVSLGLCALKERTEKRPRAWVPLAQLR